jgi:hemoglobin/transferrin/lactoferrin receptor protein
MTSVKGMPGRMATLLKTASLLPVLALALPASAADTDAEADAADQRSTITVTATRAPVSMLEAPATVSVITADDMANNLVSDIRDLVRFEPGVSVRRSPARFGAASGSTGRDGNAGFNIRGLDGNRVLTLVDGIRVPDGFDFGAQAAGRGDYVDLSLIKRVEILRGPASALYGSDGLAGVVSFVTADPQDFLRNDASIAGMARGSYDSADDSWTGTGVIAGKTGALSAMIAYTHRQGHELKNMGENDAPNSTRTKPNPQDSRSDSVLAKVVYEVGGGHLLRATYEHLDDKVDTDVLSGRAPVPTAATAVIGLTAKDKIKRDRASLDWRYSGDGTVESAQLTGYWQQADNSQSAFEDRLTAADRSRINTFDNRVFGLAGDAIFRLQTGSINHRLSVGGDASFTKQEGLRDGTVPTAPDVFPSRAFPVTNYTLVGGFIGDEIRLGEGDTGLILFPALRFDHYKLDPENDPLLPDFAGSASSGSRLSPKLGLTWRVSEGFSVVGSYAQGFKPPAPGQVNQFFQNPTSPFAAYKSIPNPDLKPETSESFEGGIRVASGPVNGMVTMFTGRYRNFISQEQIGGTGTVANPLIFQFVNLASAKIWGAEAKFSVVPVDGFTLDGAMAWAKGTTERDGVEAPLESINPLKFVLGAGWDDSQRRFGARAIATFASGKEASRTSFMPTAGYTVIDLTAYANIGEHFTVRAGLFNLLDATYIEWSDMRLANGTANAAVRGAWTQPGRNFSVSLTARF